MELAWTGGEGGWTHLDLPSQWRWLACDELLLSFLAAARGWGSRVALGLEPGFLCLPTRGGELGGSWAGLGAAGDPAAGWVSGGGLGGRLIAPAPQCEARLGSRAEACRPPPSPPPPAVSLRRVAAVPCIAQRWDPLPLALREGWELRDAAG